MIQIRVSILIIVFILTGCSEGQQLHEKLTFVSTDWLLEHLNDSSLVILHVGAKEAFDSLHIPNSQYLPVLDLIIDTDSLRHEMQEISLIDSILESTGINDQSRIVLCYENERMILVTARLFLTLDYAGLRDRTSVLNGGLEHWLAEGKKTTDIVYIRTPGDLNLKENIEVLVDAYTVREYMDNPDYMILDARPVEYYSGQFDSLENKYTGGHIEGATNLAFDYLFTEAQPYLFREDPELKREFEKTGMDDNKTIVHYCGSGMWASANYLVATHLGYKSLFYDGSFEDWEKLGLPVIKPVTHASVRD